MSHKWNEGAKIFPEQDAQQGQEEEADDEEGLTVRKLKLGLKKDSLDKFSAFFVGMHGTACQGHKNRGATLNLCAGRDFLELVTRSKDTLLYLQVVKARHINQKHNKKPRTQT